MGMHFTGKSGEVWKADITGTGHRSSACVRVWRRFISGNSLPSADEHRNDSQALGNVSFGGLLLCNKCFMTVMCNGKRLL